MVSAGICHTDLIPREQANRSPVETAVTRMRPRLRPFSTIRTVRSSIYRRVVVLRPTRRPRAQGVLAQGVEMQVDVEPAVAPGTHTARRTDSLQDREQPLRQESLSRRVRYWSDPGVCRDRAELHGDGGKQGHQSAGSHRDGPTEAELSASSRRIRRGQNRGGSVHQGDCGGRKVN